MSEPWNKANQRIGYVESLRKYPIAVQENEKKKINFKDGDFVVNYIGDLGIGMTDETKIPKITEDVYQRILKFAEKRNLKVRASKDYGIIDLKEKKAWENLKKTWKNALDFTPNRIDVGDPASVIHLQNHFYASRDPNLFEEFGREVLGLKTEAEKKQEN